MSVMCRTCKWWYVPRYDPAFPAAAIDCKAFSAMRTYGSSFGLTSMPKVIARINEPAILHDTSHQRARIHEGEFYLRANMCNEVFGFLDKTKEELLCFLCHLRAVFLDGTSVEVFMEHPSVLAPFVAVRHVGPISLPSDSTNGRYHE